MSETLVLRAEATQPGAGSDRRAGRSGRGPVRADHDGLAAGDVGIRFRHRFHRHRGGCETRCLPAGGQHTEDLSAQSGAVR